MWQHEGDIDSCRALLRRAEERVAVLLAQHQCGDHRASLPLSPEGTAYVHMGLWGAAGGAHGKVKDLLVALLAQQVMRVCVCVRSGIAGFGRLGQILHA